MNRLLLRVALTAGRFGMVASLGFAPAAAQIASAPAPASSGGSSGPQELERFDVTGSRIKRIDAETPQPLVRLTELDFRSTGFSTLGDAIRAMPAVSGTSIVSVDSGTSFTPGASSFNLRGLGANNTLVLINGRRAAPFASAGFDGFQTVFDFNSIPTAALESIEVLKDGASAIYGSDAVAGVLNINLKKNYTGLTTEFSIGNTFGTDSFEKSAFLIMGAQAGKASVLATLEYRQRNSIRGIDLDYADETDGRPYGGVDQSSSAGPLGVVFGLTDRTRFPAGTAYFAEPTSEPTLATATAGVPMYNFQKEADFLPEEESAGVYVRGSYDFNALVTGFIEASFRRQKVIVDAAATPYFTIQEQGDSPSGLGMFPKTNPYNPFGEDILDLRFRFNELGPRTQESTADTVRFVAGLEGRIGESGWNWDGALLHTENSVLQIAHNATSDRLVQNAFNGVMLNGEVHHLNPFGPNAPELIEHLRFSNPGNDLFQIRSADMSASGPIFDLPAGRAGLAVGAEVRAEKFENRGTQLNRDGQIVGGSAGADTVGDRKLYSYYAELSAPLTKRVEVQFAVRHEDYSDFGRTTNPKVAAIYRPIPEFLIRGSYGESFLAPNLAYLHTSQRDTITSGALADPLRPNDPRTQIRAIAGGNSKLQPEEADVVYGGIVLQPFARRIGSLFRELSFSADFFRYDQTSVINRLDPQQVLNNLGTFGDRLVRNAPLPGETVGTISYVTTLWENLSTSDYEGYDFNLAWILPRNEWGEFRSELSATYLKKREISNAAGALLDLDGNYHYPHLKSTATFAWKQRDWAASLFVTHIGDYRDNYSIGRVRDQIVFNPQVAYGDVWDSTVTIGVRNVLNTDPPRDLSDPKLVNDNLNFVEPAFWYVRWSKEF